MVATEKTTIDHHGNAYGISVNKRLQSDDYLFFLHGLGCAKESFDDAFTFKRLGSFSLVSFDFLGFGDSEKPDNFSYSLEAQADIAAQLIESFAAKRLSIVAHSMGGAVGLLLTQRLKGVKPSNFINIEGNLVAADCGIVSRGLAKQSFDEFRSSGSAEFLQGLKASPRPDLQAWAQWYGRAGVQAIHESAKSLVEWSDSGKLLQIFNGLEQKTYMYGDEDSKSFLLPKLTETNIVCIEDAGHFSMVDKPAELYGNIADALLT